MDFCGCSHRYSCSGGYVIYLLDIGILEQLITGVYMENGKVNNRNKLIVIKQWVLIVSIVGVILTTGAMGAMLVNDRYVVINRSDLNTANIADLTLVMEKLIDRVGIHITQSGGHEVMKERMNTMEEAFKEMKAEVKEIRRRTP